MSEEAQPVAKPAAPIKATWLLLGVTWLLFFVPIVGLGIVGWVVNFAAFIMSIVVMTRGAVPMGVTQLICTIIVSPIMYFVGLRILGEALNSGVN